MILFPIYCFYVSFLHRVNTEFENIPSYVYDDVDKWSMFDFVNVRNGTFLVTINTAIQKGEEHVLNCEVSRESIFIIPNI